MSVVYIESSAVLRWLLGTPDASSMQAVLSRATHVVTSALTTTEVGRTLQRLLATGSLSPGSRTALWRTYTGTAARWDVFAVSDDVLRRATDPFPVEPIRTLDAVHVATAEIYSRQVAPVTVLSVDGRVRDNAAALGLAVAP